MNVRQNFSFVVDAERADGETGDKLQVCRTVAQLLQFIGDSARVTSRELQIGAKTD